jgi:thymidylate synthase
MIPVLSVTAETLPEAWEESRLARWERGARMPTEYDKPSDPHSRDATMVIVVSEPLKEPRLHRAFPCGLEELEIYRQEVVEGIHDHWIDPEGGKWSYTYHERLFAYNPDPSSRDRGATNQIDWIVRKLSEVPHSRRAQAVTWIPAVDPAHLDPPCLQRIWCRLTEDDGRLLLNMNVNFRSNDAFKAAFMNMWALIDLQRTIAACIAGAIKREVGIGRYCHIADSYHIYGSYFQEFEGFLVSRRSRTFEQRVWRSDDPMVEECFAEGRRRIERERVTGKKGVML